MKALPTVVLWINNLNKKEAFPVSVYF